MKTEYSTHKSMIFAIREAISLYLSNINCKKDNIKVVESFLSLDDYKGDRVPLGAVVKEVDALCNVLQDNYLGLHLNRLVDIESLPFYKAISECIRPFSSTNNELPFLLISRLVLRFFFLLTQSIDLKLIAEKGLLRFEFISNTPEIINKHQIDGVLVIVYRIVEAFYPNMLKTIYIAHRHTSDELEYYESIFGVPIELSDTTSLVYDLKCKNHYKNAATLLIKSEEEIDRKFFINPLFNMLSTDFSRFSCKQCCEIIIDTVMGISPPTRNHIANAMNISVSTLQRRLSEEGTSFQEVLEDTRKRKVKIYLAEKNLSATDVAYLLGYKSHSQFFKAFKTWFGITPKAYQSILISHKEDHSD